jgi:AraC family transcriptional regulator
MDVLNQLNRAMAYIEEHLNDDLALGTVSSVTSYSDYHFGRLFYYVTEMPLSEYIRKRKMSQAAIALQTSRIKVIDLAVHYCYDSADSFTRAFVKQHGVTPTAARKTGVNLTIFPPLVFQIQIKGVQAMNWRIEKKEAFEVFGIKRVFDNDEHMNIPMFWTECHQNGSYEKLFDAAGGKRYPDGRGYSQEDRSCVINAACEHINQSVPQFVYMLFALKTPESITDGFEITTIPKADWAVFRSGESDQIGRDIPDLFRRAYTEWLPSSDYEKADGPDMEIYYTASTGKFFAEIWLPVRRKIN